MAISARPSSMSVRAVVCLVMLCLAQAFLQVSAQRPMLAPRGAPMYAPESAPIYAPEMAPAWSPMYTPEVAPTAPPMYAPESAPAMAPAAYTPETSPMGAPSYSPASPVMAPGPSPIQSGAARNVVSSVGVVFVGLAAFLLY